MSIPNGVQQELEASILRTGWNRQLDRAIGVLPVLFSCSPAAVEQWFRLQGQADAILAAGITDNMEEYTLTQ